MDFPIDNLVLTSAEKHTSDVGSFPVLGWAALSAIRYVHRCWFWYRRSEIWWKQDNWFKLAVGASLQWVAGDCRFVQIAAKVNEVAHHLFKSALVLRSLKTNMQRFFYLMIFKEPVYFEINKQELLEKGGFFSGHFLYTYEYAKKDVQERVKLLWDAFVNIFRDFFLLSMHSLDAQLAFQGHLLQITESFVHAYDTLTHEALEPFLDDLIEGMGLKDAAACIKALIKEKFIELMDFETVKK